MQFIQSTRTSSRCIDRTQNNIAKRPGNRAEQGPDTLAT